MHVLLQVVALFPFYCMWYMFMPDSDTGKLMRTPFMKFLTHSASYLFFLCELIGFLIIMVQHLMVFHTTGHLHDSFKSPSFKIRQLCNTWIMTKIDKSIKYKCYILINVFSSFTYITMSSTLLRLSSDADPGVCAVRESGHLVVWNGVDATELDGVDEKTAW